LAILSASIFPLLVEHLFGQLEKSIVLLFDEPIAGGGGDKAIVLYDVTLANILSPAGLASELFLELSGVDVACAHAGTTQDDQLVQVARVEGADRLSYDLLRWRHIYQLDVDSLFDRCGRSHAICLVLRRENDLFARQCLSDLALHFAEQVL